MESAPDGLVQEDGAGADPVTGGLGLKWDRIAAGWHAVKVLSGTQVWESSVEVQEGRFVTVKAFPDAARQAEAAAEAERRRQIDLKAAREAAAKQAELERQRLAYEQAARELEAQRRREQEEEEKKSYRPRAH